VQVLNISLCVFLIRIDYIRLRVEGDNKTNKRNKDS